MSDNKNVIEKSFLNPSTQHTMFSCHEVEKGCSFSIENKNENHLLFLLEGDMMISCNEFSKRHLTAKEMVLVPIAADVICRAVSACRVISFSFDTLPDIFSKHHLRSLIKVCKSTSYSFTPLPINEPLDNFISLLIVYLEKEMDSTLLHEVKAQEFFVILESFYTPVEVASLFHPLVGRSFEFRTIIMRNYRKVNSIEEFTALLGIEKRTFTRQFRDEFGVSPYQWMLNQKAKHVYFSLMETDHSLEQIREQHGFKFAAHFTRFCREQFACTPRRLRKQFLSK